MARAKKIDVASFNQLETVINKVYDSLNVLDLKLNGDIVKRFFDIAKGVNLFTNAVQKLGEIHGNKLNGTVAKIDTLFKLIDQVAQQAKNIPEADLAPLTKFANGIYRLQLALQNIDKGVEPASLDNFQKALTELTSIPGRAPLPPDFDKYIKTLRSFGRLGEVFDSLAKIQTVPLDSSSPVGKFFDSLLKLAITSQSMSFNTSLLKIVSDVSTLFKAFANSPIDKTNLNVEVMDRAFQYVQNFFKRIIEMAAGNSLSTIIKAGILFPKLTDVLDPIFKFFIRLSGASVTTFKVDQISEVLTKALADVRELFSGLIQFGKSTSLFETFKFRRVLEPLVMVIDGVVEIFALVARKSFDAGKVTAIANVFDAVSVMLSDLAIFGQKVTEKMSLFGTLKLSFLIGRFTSIFREITELFRVLGDGTQRTTKLINETKDLGGTKSSRITISDVESISDIFKTVNQLFDMLTSINYGNGKTFSLSFKGFFEGLSGITSAISGFLRFRAFSKAVTSYIKDISGLITLTKDVNPTSLVALGDIFKSIVPIVTQMVEFNTVMNAIKGGINKAAGAITLGRSMDATINAVKGVLFIAKDINPATVAGVGEIFKGLGVMFPAYADFSRSVNEALAGGVVKALTTLPIRLVAMALTVRSIMRFVREVVTLTEGLSSEKTAAVGEFAKGLGTLFQGLGSAFRAVFKETEKISDVKSFLKYLVSVELLIYPIRRVASALLGLTKDSNPAMLTAAGTFVRSVAQALLGVAKAFEQAKYLTPDLGTVLKTLFVFNRIVSPIKEIAKIMAALPKGGNFEGGAAYITAVSKFLTRMFKTFTDPAFIKADPDNGKRMKGFIDDIVKVLKAINIPAGAFKNAEALTQFAEKFDKIKNLDEVFKGLASGLSAVKGIEAGNVTPIFKALGDGLVEFSKGIAKLTPAEVDRLEKLSLVLKNLPANTNLAQALNMKGAPIQSLTEVRDLSEDVAQGMQRANIRAAAFQFVMSAIGSIFNALDPRRPIQLIIDGFQRAGQLITDFKTKIFEAFEAIRDMGDRMKDLGFRINDLFGIGNITNSGIFKASIEFDKLGSSLEVFGGLSKEQRKEAEDFANVLGKDYPLSANEAMQATLDLIKAGQSLDSARSILPAAADLASLSDSGSIEQATNFIIQATSTFKEFSDTVAGGFENASVAVDIIAAAADTSTASVEGLAEGLANVGPVASQFGLSLEETSAVLAIFTDNGISGAEAGTQLKSFLTSLTTDAAQKELRRLGVAIEDSATGKIRPLNDILNDLQHAMYDTQVVFTSTAKNLSGTDAARLNAAQKALAGATQRQILLQDDLTAQALGEGADKALQDAQTIAANAEKVILELTGSQEEATRIRREIERSELTNAESLKKIAGSYGQSGLAILLAQGEDGLMKFVEQMQAVEPASVRARKALDNISGDMIQLQGSVETLGTKALVPLLEKFFRPFVQLARFVVDSFLAIDDSVIEFISTTVALGASLATVIGSTLVLVGGLIQLGGASAAVVTFLGIGAKALTIGFLGALTGLIAGVATLAAGFLILTPVLALITTGFNTLSKIFTEDLGGATTQLRNLLGNIGGALYEVGTALSSVLGVVVQFVSGDVSGGLEGFGANLASFFNSLSLSVTKFRTSGFGKTLIDIGGIFKGLYATMTLGAQQDAAVAAVADTIESANRLPNQAKRAREAVAKSYAELVLSLTKNNRILQGVFGKDVTVEELTSVFNIILTTMGVLRERIGAVFGSFGRAFDSAKTIFSAEGGSFGAAMQTFFSELVKNLDDTLGNLAGTVLNYLSLAFNLDGSELSNIFREGGFAKGISKAFGLALKRVGEFLLNNRDGIKGMLTFVFEKLFLGSFSLAKTLSDLFGLEQISGILGGAIETIKGIFGGIVDTVFNLIEGQSITDALVNAFGPGIQPFLDLVGALGDTVDNIVGIIGKIFNAIFNPPTEGGTGEPFLLTLFNTVTNGLTSFLNFLNTNVLDFLAAGDIGGLLSNIAAGIGGALSGLNLDAAFADIANTVVGAIGSAITTAFSTLGTLLGFDGAAVLADIDSTISDTLNGLDANTALAKVQASIGTLMSAISNVFGGEDGESIFDNISTIVSKLSKALTDLFAVFGTSDADAVGSKGNIIVTALQGLIDVLGSIVSSSIDTLTDLADGVDKLVGALALLSPAELLFFAGALGAAGLAIVGVAGGGAILTALGAGFTALSAALLPVLTPLVTVIAPLFVIIQFVRALAQNLDTFTEAVGRLSQGDVAGAIGKAIEGVIGVFTDLGFNLIEFLGIDTIVGLSREEFHKFGSMVAFVVENAARRAGGQIREQIIKPIQDFVNITIPYALSKLEEVRLAAKAALGDEQAALGVGVFQNIESFTSGTDFAAVTEAELAGLAADVEKGGASAQARLTGMVASQVQDYYDSAIEGFIALPDDPALKAEYAAKLAGFFDLAGVSDDVLLIASQSGDASFMQALIGGMLSRGIEITPAMQKTLVDSITAGFNVLDPESASSALNQLDLTIATLAALELDTTYLEAERAKLQAAVDAYLTNPPGGTPTTDAPVTVTPVVTTGEPVPGEGPDPFDPASPNYVGKMLVRDEAGVVVPLDVNLQPNWKKLEDADGSQILPTLQEAAQAAVDGIPAATPLVNFDSSSLTDPTKVTEFNQLIGTLITNIQTLGTELGGVASTTEPVKTALTEIQGYVTVFRDVATPLFKEVGDSVVPIGTGISAVTSALLVLFATAGLGFPALALAALLATGSIVLQFSIMRSAADTNLKAVVDRVRELAGAFKDAALAASSLSNNPAFGAAGGGTGGGGGTMGPGRASGGPVIPGKLYPFLEKRLPELLQLGNKTFLAVPQAGKVTPLSAMTSSRSTGMYNAPRGPRQGLLPSAMASSSVIIEQGDTNININGSNLTPAQLATEIRRQVSAVRDQKDARLSDKLRAYHR